MLKGQDIICVSSIDWDFIWQGHQEIMSALAACGNRVIFIENTGVRSPNLRDMPRMKKRVHNWLHSVKGIRKERENLYIYSPIVLPFPYSKIARWINKHLLVSGIKKWNKSAGFTNPIIWTFLPTALILDLIDGIDNKAVIYYCIDNFAASSPQARRITATEDTLLRRADLVFVTAKNLYDRCSRFNKNVHIFPYGVNMDVYAKAQGVKMEPPSDMKAIRHPIVGYIGGVHKWIDINLIKFLSEKNPQKSFVFIGPLQRNIDVLKGIKNVYFLGQKRYEELPSYVAQFDVCTIPYLFTEYTKNVYPTKVNEYLSLGKPVVATAIPELEAFNDRNDDILFIGRSREEISVLLDKSISEKVTNELYRKRVEAAMREGSWKTKIEDMAGLIEEKLADKARERSLEWKKNLLKIYKRSRKGVMLALVSALAIYMILFHTSFIWVVGRPLKISSVLQKADVIVVLAGGVGESGRANQGYEERVEYGVRLYKEGYAPYLIFSSGFRYAFREAEVMKALAVSLGVPSNAIILEDRASNTYENIKFSRDIVANREWKTAILVSSPYNMKRASFVCKKVAPDIHFLYAPIPHSIFYGDGYHVELKHILGIFHDYIGIIYYYLK